MTQAEKCLQQMKINQSVDVQYSQMPAEKCLQETLNSPAINDSKKSERRSEKRNVGFKFLAVLSFLAFVAAGIYFVKISRTGNAVLGFMLVAMGFGALKLLWKR